ncbi:MAG TPA: hypothetical protein VNG29_03540 [Candidatus Paceibacterota bacterium]|nr:hypothetical protein [Candidatus Paceibacterota bacterium]
MSSLAQIQNLISTSTLRSVGAHSLSVYSSYLPLLKTISIFVSSFFVIATVFFIARTGWLTVRLDRVEDVVMKKNLPKERSKKTWQKVQRHLFAGDDANLKLALLEADKVLDDALRHAGIRGNNLGDRLKGLDEAKLPNLQQVWEAHKLRNRLVHESDFKLNRDTAERALAIYEEAFKKLGLLDATEVEAPLPPPPNEPTAGGAST